MILAREIRELTEGGGLCGLGGGLCRVQVYVFEAFEQSTEEERKSMAAVDDKATMEEVVAEEKAEPRKILMCSATYSTVP